LIGDDKNMVYAAVEGNAIRLLQVKKDEVTVLAEATSPKLSAIKISVEVKNSTQATFSWSTDGKRFTPLNSNAADISYLPPWDRAVRVGMVSKGPVEKAAFFRSFILDNL
jgi:hypothetical protein